MHIPRLTSLYRLFASISSLPGIGPKLAAIIEKRIGGHLIDVLRHMPVSRMTGVRPSVDMAEDGQLATFDVLVLSADIPPGKTGRPARITTETKGGRPELIFSCTCRLAEAKPAHWRKAGGQRACRALSGAVANGTSRFYHPSGKAGDIPEIEPIYPPAPV